MKKVLSFDIDQTLNIAKTPILDEIAELLRDLLDYYEICPISGQKFDQFLIQIVKSSVTGSKTRLPKAMKLSKTASAKSPSLPSVRRLAPRQNIPGIQTARSAKPSSLAPKNSRQHLLTKLAVLPVSMPLLQA